VNAALQDVAGAPLSAVVRDSAGVRRVLRGEAYRALHMAVLALDAQLRGAAAGYQENASTAYAALVPLRGMMRVREAFELPPAGPQLVSPG
jgi:hypothetical protein